MMSKIFLARCELSDAITAAGECTLLPEKWFAARKVVSEKMDALVEVARAEGCENGIGQERERIRGESQMVGVDEDCIKFIGSVDNYVGSAFLVPVDVMDPPLSVSASPREK